MTLWQRIVWLASWIMPPIGMAGAYSVLAWSSETDNTGKAWMAVGFGFVLILWIVFRLAVEGAGVSRALAVGDAEKLLAITNKQLARKRSDAARAPYLIYKALAHDLRGEHAEALADATEAKPMNERDSLLAASVRAVALAELARVPEARAVVTEIDELAKKVDPRLKPLPHQWAQVARARVLAAEGRKAEADAVLDKLLGDIRSGAGIRARAEALRAVTK
jgi:tetratricopeptide (TPR) repeat protein